MKTINIFIACSPTSEILADQKEVLSKKCRELNTELAEIGKGFYINPIAYENPERRMEVFKKHIKKDDIAIFLFDNERDAVLLDEFEQAVKRNNDLNKPEVLVFASDKIKENKEYDDKVKQICADGGWLYEPLKNTEDLWDNVKEKTYRYVRSYQKIIGLRRWSIVRYYGARCLLCVPILLALSFYLWMENINLNKQLETKRLLIVGGGSARNYIEKRYLKNDSSLVKLNPDLWWYAPMPSSDSYRIIAEEIINITEDYKTRPYYPIILSATKAKNDSCFNKNNGIPGFKSKAIVVGIHIGDDSLVVYAGSKSKYDSVYIECAKLDNLVKDPDITILRTSVTSGTFNTYIDSVCSNLKDKEGLKFFSDSDTLLEQYDDKEWIALGSEYYYPKGYKVRSLVVKNTRIVQKPIYIYFLLYYDKFSKDYYLPAATKEFLERIGVKNTIINQIENIKSYRSIDNNKILYDDFELN